MGEEGGEAMRLKAVITFTALAADNAVASAAVTSATERENTETQGVA
jgi:hypothetical protein